MITRTDLGSLLFALRGAGLRIGVAETLGAEFLLGTLAESPAPLALALRALLAKSTEERDAFDRIFAEWAAALAQREPTAAQDTVAPPAVTVQSDAPSVPAAAAPQREVRTKPRARRWRRWLAAIVVFLALLGLGSWRWLAWRHSQSNAPSPPVPPVETPAPTPERPPKPTNEADTPALPPAPPVPQRTTQWVPHVSSVLSPPIPRTLWYGLASLGLWVGLLGIAYVRSRRHQPRRVLVRAGTALRAGTPRVFLDIRPTPGALPRLLERQTEEALVWGIDKYVSEEPTRRIDVRRTVVESARSVLLPVVHFQRARHPREVWLWLDESMQLFDPAAWTVLSRLADEIERALRQSGLPVERAVFYGVPDVLTLQDAQGRSLGRVTPADLDERRGQARTAILTTGEMLRKQLGTADQRRNISALLRVLAHFPQLCFVDGTAGSALADLLRPYELLVIAPSELATYLGGERSRQRRPGCRPSDVLAWAAACALPMEPITEDTALWLRQGLQLPTRPEALAELRALSGSRGGALRFPLHERARLLAEQLGPLSRLQGPLAERSLRLAPTLLGRALDLFRQRIAEEDAQRRKHDSEQPFVGTEGEQHLRLQRALLDLWDRPLLAVGALEALAQGTLADEVRHRLADYVPAEMEGSADKLVLPWALREVETAAQRFLDLGLGGASLASAALVERTAGRQLVAQGGAVGALLAAVGILGLGIAELRHPHGEPQIRQANAPKDALVEVTQQSASEYLVSARLGAEQTSVRVPAGSRVLVSWAEEERDPPDGGDEPPRDLGADLAHAEDLTTPRDLSAPPDLAPPPWSCPYAKYTEPKSGMVFVKVCAGDFMMGSAKNDRDAEDDEKPAYPVHIDTFWMGKYEVSNAQYRKKDASHKSTNDGENLPVQNVSWTEARAYCRSVGGDLPTEAEWEYAARGPTARKYPWGKAEPTADRAVFDQLPPYPGPEAITAKPRGRGPFGTLNQAGNVWEWVTDCYQADRYAKRKAQSDKTVPPSPIANPVDDRPGCDLRVLRGGSFSNEPRILRAAFRDRNGPEDPFRYVGFRCVRGSVRQP